MHKTFALYALLPLAALAASAPAMARSECDDLRPEQRLSAEAEREVQSVLQGAIAGIGGIEVGASTSTSTKIQVLSNDALATSWFIYQACVMKDAGVVSEQTAEQLVRSLLGLEAVALPSGVIGGPGGVIEEGSGYINITAQDDYVQVKLDGHSLGHVGEGARLPVAAGTHQLTLSLRGHHPVERTVIVLPDTTADVNIDQMQKISRRWMWGVAGVATLTIGGVVIRNLVHDAVNDTGIFYDEPLGPSGYDDYRSSQR